MSEAVEQAVWNAIREVNDPELGINVVDLGLVYSVDVHDQRVRVTITMTTPTCPLGAHLAKMTEDAIRRSIPQVQSVDVELVWEPPWHPGMMSELAKRQLGWTGE